MDKSADAFRTISEVAEDLGIPKHVLRFWELKFVQIRPMKRGGGRRYYRPEDMELLRGVRHLLHRDGYTIKGVQKILREQGAEVVKQLGRGEVPASLPAPTGESVPDGPPVRATRAKSGRERRGGTVPSAAVPLAAAPAATSLRAGPPALAPEHVRAIRAALAALEECRQRLRGDTPAVAPEKRRGATV